MKEDKAKLLVAFLIVYFYLTKPICPLSDGININDWEDNMFLPEHHYKKQEKIE
jgi:hypothetical protein